MTNDNITPQAAAIPVRDDGKICLITSSNGNRWGIPKGMIDPGMTAEETALQESWEEAGIRGQLDPEPVGRFRYRKWGLHLEVTVFLLRITDIEDDWPEQYRERRWVSPKKAAALIDRDEVAEMVRECFDVE